MVFGGDCGVLNLTVVLLK